MELRQLAYLVAVAEERSFTRAAERLHVAQPGISAQVRRLEAELGHELLDRSGREVTLTDAGRAVISPARAALAGVDGVRGAIDELSGLLRGSVRFGVLTSLTPSPFDLPGLIAAFSRGHPAIEISLREDVAERLLADLREGAIDLALVGLTEHDVPEGVEIEPVLEDEFVLVVADADPLAARKRVEIAELAERTFISMPRGAPLRESVEAACAREGFRPQVRLEGSFPLVLAKMAAEGLGVAVIPAGSAMAHREGLAVIELRPRLRGRIALAWRAGGPASPAARALLAHARARLS